MKRKYTYKLRMVIFKRPDDWDSDDVYFKVGTKIVGTGYKGRATGGICIVRCPKCSKENYAVAISTGLCAFCKYNPNL